MLPMQVLARRLGELLAAEAAFLAPAADNNEMALIKGSFSEGDTIVIGDLELADFDGSDPLPAGLGTQLCGVDPVTGDQVITIKSPAGGWRWEASGATNLPQTIYGRALTTKDGAALLGVELLDEPITITAAGQEIDLPPATFRIPANPMS